MPKQKEKALRTIPVQGACMAFYAITWHYRPIDFSQSNFETSFTMTNSKPIRAIFIMAARYKHCTEETNSTVNF